MAITVNETTRTVAGNRRHVIYDLDVGVDADTLDTLLTQIDVVLLNPVDETAVGATVSGGTITFQIGGSAANGMGVLVIGI